MNYQEYKKELKCEVINDSFQNYKKYAIRPAQLVIADIPYTLGWNFYANRPDWYIGGDNKNGESKNAKKAAFYSDYSFNIAEYWHFCHKLLKKDDTSPVERGRSSNSPCMIMFCAFQQMDTIIKTAEKHGFKHYRPIVLVKNYSGDVLKANMTLAHATEFALLLYRDKLPKFRNGSTDGEKMIFDWIEYRRDGKEVPQIHKTQKPQSVLKRLIETFTDEGDVVIDPCAGSFSTGRACKELGRNFYGFEISKKMCELAKTTVLNVNYATEKEQIPGQMNIMELLNNG